VTYRIEGYCIINRLTGERWGSLYESERGAVASFNTSSGIQDYDLFTKKMKFKDQDIFILQPLVLIE
jgi:hypothetical protein